MTRRFLTPLSTNHVDFNTSHPSTPDTGRVFWNSEEGTLDLGMNDEVVQAIGMQFYMPPTNNNSGVEIPKGSFVMATGVQGDRITIAKAVTNGSVNPEYMIGFAAQTIGIGSETGLIVTHGTIKNINTSLWPVGTILYPSSASAGSLTASADTSPAISTPIAIVLRQHQNTGRIYVRMTNAHKLGGEQDVKITSPQNGDTLTYNSSTNLWENNQPTITVQSGSAYPLSNLTNGELFYNTSNGRTAIYFNSFWKEFAYVTDLPLNGGAASTTVFDDSIDGGTPTTTVFVGAYDGGLP